MLVSLAVLAQEEEAFGSHVWNRSPSVSLSIYTRIYSNREYTGCRRRIHYFSRSFLLYYSDLVIGGTGNRDPTFHVRDSSISINFNENEDVNFRRLEKYRFFSFRFIFD